MKRQFTIYHSVPMSSWYSIDWPQKDERLSWLWSPEFSIWKSLRMLLKTCIKIKAPAIYTYLFFKKNTLLFCCKIKCCCDCCFPQHIRQITAQLNILQDYSSVTPHTAHSVDHVSLNMFKFQLSYTVLLRAKQIVW